MLCGLAAGLMLITWTTGYKKSLLTRHYSPNIELTGRPNRAAEVRLRDVKFSD